MDYNTQREKLTMPEYGRHIQKMVEMVKEIPDREKRNEQIRAVVQAMGILNPSMRDQGDFKHKLWDHVQIIGDWSLDVDAPYPMPEKTEVNSRPQTIKIEKTPIKATCYGRNIENMIDLIASREDDEAKREMIKMLALYMRQQYLIWNKDSVAEETIFADMERLSGGRLKVPEDLHLVALSSDASFSRPGMNLGQRQNGGGFKKNKSRNRNRKSGGKQ